MSAMPKPASDDAKRRRWIRLIERNLSIRYRDDPGVLVASDLQWHADEGGQPEDRLVPGVLVAFGRPKGERDGYRQWLESGVAPQVVFDVLSPGDDYMGMMDRCDWFEDHGVEEYYVIDPKTPDWMRVRVREGDLLRPRKPPHGFVSPRMGVRFDLSNEELTIFSPDGRRFLDAGELDALRTDEADKRAADEKRRADEAEWRAACLARQVELSRKARRGEASAEELAELDRLESEP